MSEITHSQGPWSVDGPVHSIIVYAADGSRICFMTSDGPAEANARLIAAAPDMLEALKEILATDFSQESSWDYSEGIKDVARDAIAKAEGRSNG